MNRSLKISVCMASYNGEKYIVKQIESIVPQLDEFDEIVISDDGSSDSTKEIAEKYSKTYENIRIYDGPKTGFASNFANAVSHANGDIIIFSDQDDIWAPSKIDTIYECFVKNQNATTILHNMKSFDEQGLISEKLLSYQNGVFENIVKSCYWGCCMAVKKEFITRFLPFRTNCVGHDQLTGLMSEKYGKTVFIDNVLTYHRIHDHNTSNKLPISKKISFRINLIADYLFAKKNWQINNFNL